MLILFLGCFSVSAWLIYNFIHLSRPLSLLLLRKSPLLPFFPALLLPLALSLSLDLHLSLATKCILISLSLSLSHFHCLFVSLSLLHF